MSALNISVRISLPFLENPLDTLSAEGWLSQKAQFSGSRPVLPNYLQIRLSTLPPSTSGCASCPTASSTPAVISLKNYNSVDAKRSLVKFMLFFFFFFLILNEAKFFSSACLPTLFGSAAFGCCSCQLRYSPRGSLQAEPVVRQPLLKTSELQSWAFVWNAD